MSVPLAKLTLTEDAGAVAVGVGAPLPPVGAVASGVTVKRPSTVRAGVVGRRHGLGADRRGRVRRAPAVAADAARRRRWSSSRPAGSGRRSSRAGVRVGGVGGDREAAAGGAGAVEDRRPGAAPVGVAEAREAERGRRRGGGVDLDVGARVGGLVADLVGDDVLVAVAGAVGRDRVGLRRDRVVGDDLACRRRRSRRCRCRSRRRSGRPRRAAAARRSRRGPTPASVPGVKPTLSVSRSRVAAAGPAEPGRVDRSAARRRRRP